jgi:acyl-coenzyme A synthetase/AMP-(fatty) acid ligase
MAGTSSRIAEYTDRDAAHDAYGLLGSGDDDRIVAVRAGRVIGRDEFLRDVAALAARLPARKYVLNLCTDRYRFMVALGAALRRRQISLLPPNETHGVLQALAEDYPDHYTFVDTARRLVSHVMFPSDLECSRFAAADEPIEGTQAAILLFTSGSTGRPKPVAKNWGTLVRSARSAGRRLGVQALNDATVISTVPHQHSYGFESIILLALQHGLIVDAAAPLYPGDIRARIEAASGPRILVTAPVHIRVLVNDPGGMPRVDLILSATAPLPAPLAAQAEACFGGRLMEIYGCTEAGQIATRRTAREAHWRCFDGVELCQGAAGAWASGPAVEGSAMLHDGIELTGAGRFLLGGRAADLVNIAGKRASLADLNHQLTTIEGVEDGVFLMQEAAGQRVARLMALAVAPGLVPETILRMLRDRIDAAFLPRPLVLVDALPRNSLGKLPREALLALIGRGRLST